MDFSSKIAINKGWSDDKKYCVTDQNQKLDSKKFEFDMMEKVASLGVPMCKPINIELCDDELHSLHEWIDGKDARETILTVSKEQQYIYGVEAGRILQKIHSLPVTEVREDWEVFYNRKIDDKISKYKECPVQYKNGQIFIDFLNANRELLKDRPQVFQHGDYHIGNFMIGEDLDHKVPDLFWKLLAIYILNNIVGALPWAVPYGIDEISVMQQQAKEILEWYNDMKQIIPSWYLIEKKLNNKRV